MSWSRGQIVFPRSNFRIRWRIVKVVGSWEAESQRRVCRRPDVRRPRLIPRFGHQLRIAQASPIIGCSPQVARRDPLRLNWGSVVAAHWQLSIAHRRPWKFFEPRWTVFSAQYLSQKLTARGSHEMTRIVRCHERVRYVQPFPCISTDEVIVAATCKSPDPYRRRRSPRSLITWRTKSLTAPLTSRSK